MQLKIIFGSKFIHKKILKYNCVLLFHNRNMKDISNLFTKEYSVVGSRYHCNSESGSYIQNKKKSLNASRVFNQNFSLIDSLFSSRSSSQNLRLPTGK